MGPTKTIQISLPPFDLRLETVADPDGFLDAYLNRSFSRNGQIEEDIPYWAELWSSALGLAQYLVEEGRVGPGQEVIEIGCGLGLPGIVAGLMGAEVLLTDHLEEAVAFARRNWALNLDRAPRAKALDWRSPGKEARADLVLGSDIAYEERFFQDLIPAFHRLCRPGGRILLSEPGRAITRPFLANLEEAGFEVAGRTVKGTWEGADYQVGIFELKPTGPS